MLVLTRRPNEQIDFPELGISVQVLGIRGSAVKVGIDAPADVRVLRHELTGQAASRKPVAPELPPTVATRLNNLSVLLHQFQGQRSRGQTSLADTTLAEVFATLQALDCTAPRQPRADVPLVVANVAEGA